MGATEHAAKFDRRIPMPDWAGGDVRKVMRSALGPPLNGGEWPRAGALMWAGWPPAPGSRKVLIISKVRGAPHAGDRCVLIERVELSRGFVMHAREVPAPGTPLNHVGYVFIRILAAVFGGLIFSTTAYHGITDEVTWGHGVLFVASATVFLAGVFAPWERRLPPATPEDVQERLARALDRIEQACSSAAPTMRR